MVKKIVLIENPEQGLHGDDNEYTLKGTKITVHRLLKVIVIDKINEIIDVINKKK